MARNILEFFFYLFVASLDFLLKRLSELRCFVNDLRSEGFFIFLYILAILFFELLSYRFITLSFLLSEIIPRALHLFALGMFSVLLQNPSLELLKVFVFIVQSFPGFLVKLLSIQICFLI